MNTRATSVTAPRRRLLRAAAAWPLAAAMAAGLAGCERRIAGESASGGAPLPPSSFKSIDITGADYAQALDLPDADGKRRTLAEFKGKVVVLFFGYTQCPDVCPTTMTELAAAKQQLGADGARVVPVFVTVDPERDTPAVLKAYVANFGTDFVALRGTLDETKAVAKAFKIFYAKVPGKTESSYTVDHTARSYVYDTLGRLRLATRHAMGPEALASDLRQLLNEKA
ncbi:MAG: SCO family protein [Rubrivivax sp.]